MKSGALPQTRVVDIFSAGLVCGVLGAWAVNTFDISVCRPVQTNLSRLLTGYPPLPYDFGNELSRAATGFAGWWLVVGVGLFVAVMATKETTSRHRLSGKVLGLTVSGFWLVAAILYGMYFFPSTGEMLVDWLTKLPIALIIGASLFLVPFLLARLATKLAEAYL